MIAGRRFEGSDMLGNNRACRTSFTQPYAAVHPLTVNKYTDRMVVFNAIVCNECV